MRRLLIVEDDDILNDVYKMILSTEPYDIDVAFSGQEALNHINKQSYDLILLDLMMPEMDGVEFLQQFQPDLHPETKIIITSNLSAGDMVTQAMQLGAHKSVVKADLSPKQLINLVRYEVEAK